MGARRNLAPKSRKGNAASDKRRSEVGLPLRDQPLLAAGLAAWCRVVRLRWVRWAADLCFAPVAGLAAGAVTVAGALLSLDCAKAGTETVTRPAAARARNM